MDERGKGRVSRLRWQSSIRIKDPNSPLNHPAVLLGSPVGGERFVCPKTVRKTIFQAGNWFPWQHQECFILLSSQKWRCEKINVLLFLDLYPEDNVLFFQRASIMSVPSLKERFRSVFNARRWFDSSVIVTDLWTSHKENCHPGN